MDSGSPRSQLPEQWMPASKWAPHFTAGVGCLTPFPWTASGLRRMEGCREGFGEPRPPSTHRAAPGAWALARIKLALEVCARKGTGWATGTPKGS